ncbi:zinc-alpha-2-glycoprotein-like [Labeo rohita]|uniref:zinc-alpha-2-glycoprotein-like n=1 Tax=Labeo rohita TaxID=84645 RepID=UPI0021E1EC9E|nr:zinc-alpha-2-glycoprotein-like [Labeo rohita]
MFWRFLLFLFFLIPPQSNAKQEKHFLHYKFTALSKADTLPEFSAVAVADDRQIKHYSNEKRLWIKLNLTEDDWTEAPLEPPDSREWFIHWIRTLSNCTNPQCSQLHVLQRIIGCELEKFPNETVKSLRAFDEYGFDGENYIAFNSDTLQWIDKNPKAKETKMTWDHETERNEHIQVYLRGCLNWIITFNNAKKSKPAVHVFARKAPDDHSKLVLTCLATGFYPRDIEMNIRLDRTIIKNQRSSGFRPNADGSFQMRTSVEIDRNHMEPYECLIIHSSLKQQVVIKWDSICLDCEISLWYLAFTAAIILLPLLVNMCVQWKRLNGQTTDARGLTHEDSVLTDKD